MRHALALLLVLFASSVFAAEFPAVGAPAPEFEGMKEYRGKWVVLYFYPKDFTSGCTMQARAFQRDLPKYEERNAVVIGVSVDSADSHKDFCAKEGLSFKLLADTDARLSAAYNSVMEYQGKKLSARNTFLIDPKGNLVRVFEKVKPAENSAEVLAAIDQISSKL
ncbi:MAG TPA: peroxiredoxin [Thermoanaerobaculia bacterium]|nr:peroxiredoxin [Thermoanaerobaculia bacterium]